MKMGGVVDKSYPEFLPSSANFRIVKLDFLKTEYGMTHLEPHVLAWLIIAVLFIILVLYYIWKRLIAVYKESPKPEKKRVIASAGLIVYRWNGGRLEVAVGIRQKPPWAGSWVVVFCGLMETDDDSDMVAALREGKEELFGKKYPDSGELAITHRIGNFGPQNRHYHLRLHPKNSNKLIVEETDRNISETDTFLNVVFAAEYMCGTFQGNDNDEVHDLRFVEPIALVDCDLAFDEAHMLVEFLNQMNYDSSRSRRPEFPRSCS